jgi:hypothetical protein
MNNLKRFTTEADYSAATLNYPAVSWVTSGDTVHFDKTSPVVPNTKVKVAFTTDSSGLGKTFHPISNSGLVDYLNGITVNGTPIQDVLSDCAYIDLEANTDYLIEYDIKPTLTDARDYFNIGSVSAGGSNYYRYDILFPSQITSIGTLRDYIDGFANIIFEATTPPSYSPTSSFLSEGRMYVPDAAISAYITSYNVSSYKVSSISVYNGKIPV